MVSEILRVSVMKSSGRNGNSFFIFMREGGFCLCRNSYSSSCIVFLGCVSFWFCSRNWV